MEDKETFILQSQYHGCWWPGDTRSHGINNHGINLVLLSIPSSATNRLNFQILNQEYLGKWD